MNKEELEERLRKEYREYTIEQAKIAVADASKIDYYNGALSATLLQLRVSPYHHWRQRRLSEMKIEELKTEGSGNSPNKKEVKK
ncbi:MAG: hypothetical protein DRN17_00105 [Thermoplasmata archaeon]|nr:MAG: hypothetical protein DRN17_00105 [Thermoplasmata archaeon]